MTTKYRPLYLMCVWWSWRERGRQRELGGMSENTGSRLTVISLTMFEYRGKGLEDLFFQVSLGFCFNDRGQKKWYLLCPEHNTRTHRQLSLLIWSHFEYRIYFGFPGQGFQL